MAAQKQIFNARERHTRCTTLLCKVPDADCASNMQRPWCMSSAAVASSQGLSVLKDTKVLPQQYTGSYVPSTTLSTVKTSGQNQKKQSGTITSRFSGASLSRLTSICFTIGQPHIVLTNYKELTGVIIDIAVPRDQNIQDEQVERIDKYKLLKIELKQLWKVKIIVLSVVVGALSAIADRLPAWLAQISGMISEVELQKSALLRTAHVLQRVRKLPGLWQSPRV